jgi:hypothetical protein
MVNELKNCNIFSLPNGKIWKVALKLQKVSLCQQEECDQYEQFGVV